MIRSNGWFYTVANVVLVLYSVSAHRYVPINPTDWTFKHSERSVGSWELPSLLNMRHFWWNSVFLTRAEMFADKMMFQRFTQAAVSVVVVLAHFLSVLQLADSTASLRSSLSWLDKVCRDARKLLFLLCDMSERRKDMLLTKHSVTEITVGICYI